MNNRIVKNSLSITAAALMLSACSASGGNADEITVISREDGSGTRGAFVELTGVEVKADDGSKTDLTYEEAIIANSTDVVMTQVSGNPSAIGYISLGSLNDTVKAVTIDGTAASQDNIKSGSYSLARPFNIAVKEGLSSQSQDFIDYIMSVSGQQIIADNKYIPIDTDTEYTPSGTAGKITVAGSSSVAPVMEKLAEGYMSLNPDAVIEVQQTDSTSGIKAVSDGTCDIGMASRELKDSELASGIMPSAIAMDGIAVIVSTENPVNNLSVEQIRQIFTGDITSWGDVQ